MREGPPGGGSFRPRARVSALVESSPARMDKCADGELVALIRAGSDVAFEVVVERYEGALRAYSAKMVGRDRAQDVTQQTFLKALLALRKTEREVALRPWLYRIARNVALNTLADRGARDEPLTEHTDGVPQPFEILEVRMQVSAIVERLNELPARQRAALVAHEVEGRSYAEIAERLGGSENVVRALIMRARTAVRQVAYGLLPAPLVRSVSSQGPSTMTTVGSAAAATGAAPVHLAAALITGAVLVVGAGVVLPHRVPPAQPAIAQSDVSTPKAASPLLSVAEQPPPAFALTLGPTIGEPTSAVGSASSTYAAVSPLSTAYSSQPVGPPVPSSSASASSNAGTTNSTSPSDPSSAAVSPDPSSGADASAASASGSDTSATGTTTDQSAGTDPSASDTTATDPAAATTDASATDPAAATTDPAATAIDPNATTTDVSAPSGSDPSAAVSSVPPAP